MKKSDKLTAMAIQSKCVICGNDIGIQIWECGIKNKKHFFAHYSCLYPSKLKNKGEIVND